MKRDDEQSLKDAGLSLGSSKQNILKIVPREAATPSIVISLANKGEDGNDPDAEKEESSTKEHRRVRRYKTTVERKCLSVKASKYAII